MRQVFGGEGAVGAAMEWAPRAGNSGTLWTER